MTTNKNIPNYELLALCIGELGGENIDREDAYYKMFEKSPDQYSWRTKHIPDIKKCDASLNPAEHKHELVERSSTWGLSLTAKGMRKYLELKSKDDSSDLKIGGKPSVIPDWQEEIFNRILKSDTFINWQKNKQEENAWTDIYDCYLDLKIKPNVNDTKLVEFIKRLTKSTNKFEKYQQIDQFFEQVINNLKRSKS